MIDNSGGSLIDATEYPFLPVSVYSMAKNQAIADLANKTNKWLYNCCAVMEFVTHRFSPYSFRDEVIKANKNLL